MSNAAGQVEVAAHDHTRYRLLLAAGEIFAAKGYEDATVREICQLACANVAAVNYHFGGKEGLYEAVFTAAAAESRARSGIAAVFDAKGSPEDRLAVFVRAILAKVLGDEPANLHGKLMTREMVSPTPVLKKMVEKEIKPFFAELHAIVQELLAQWSDGNAISDEQIRRSCYSVVGQCLFYKHFRPVASLLNPGVKEDHEALAQHITSVSLGGLRALAQANRTASASKPAGKTKV